MSRLFLLGIVFLFTIDSTEAGCRTIYGVKSIRRKGKTVEYCESTEGFKMLLGSKPIFKGRNCYNCECTKIGLKCCSPFSIIFAPYGCTYVIDDCEPIFVRKEDPYIHCMSDIPVWKKSDVLYHRT